MYLADGEVELQISYSTGFTILSFFVPITTLLASLLSIGSNEYVTWWRILIGGMFCSGAICGMHYLGNASISNYHCIYSTANIVGSALIAFAASTVALSMFFVLRASWTNAWWKRIAAAVVLSSSVCGMHWCAALGTTYRFIAVKGVGSGPSRQSTVIVVITLVSLIYSDLLFLPILIVHF